MKTLKVSRPSDNKKPLKGPLVLMYEKGEGKDKVKVVKSVAFGETFQEDERTAYGICAAYPGLVTIVDAAPATKAMSAAPRNK